MQIQAPNSSSPLRGKRVDSETQPGVSFELIRLIAQGGMGAAYFAERHAPEGSAPVVVKVINPRLAGGRVAPDMVALKEAVALSRVNETVPPTPYVVRYIDSGASFVIDGATTAWTALEYVHGGLEGTTLEDRVAYAVHRTGYAFDPVRAAHAVRCIAAGLSAIHAAAVLHRDLSPGNVLCCGLGDEEVLKISDFGVARSAGLNSTFQGMKVGTLGYTAPEAGAKNAGYESDIFSLAAIVYFLLTGQHYFDAANPSRLMTLVAAPTRPSVRLHATLSPELQERPEACARIDALLARATALLPQGRPQTAQAFASALLPALVEGQSDPHSSRRVVAALLSERFPTAAPLNAQWIEKCHAVEGRFIRSMAMDSEGRALALSPEGLLFWDGNHWLDARLIEARLPFRIRSIERHEGGGWLVSGGTGAFGVIDAAGGVDLVETEASTLGYGLVSGHVDDLLLAIRTLEGPSASSGFWPSETAEAVLFSHRQPQAPLPLPRNLQVNSLKRLGEARWLMAGRRPSGGGFAMICEPLARKFTPVEVPELRAFIGGGSCPERSQALLAGSDGIGLRVTGDAVDIAEVPGRADLAAAAVDILGNEWLTSPGVLWSRPASELAFRPAWVNPKWSTPFISLMAEPGHVVAVTCDGAVLEGLFSFRR